MRNNFQLKTKDERFMKLALQEAAKADHKVFPNPKVGAIVVHDDNIISRGYHQKYGERHAEAIAIDKLDRSITNATLYVTLEPCSHTGKRSPCTEIIKSKIANCRVILFILGLRFLRGCTQRPSSDAVAGFYLDN